jgi:hypothetical protein
VTSTAIRSTPSGASRTAAATVAIALPLAFCVAAEAVPPRQHPRDQPPEREPPAVADFVLGTGDCNGDTLVDVLDVFYLVNHLFGPAPLGPSDANADGKTSPDLGGQAALTGPSGPVDAKVVSLGMSLAFLPRIPLDPDTTYDVTVTGVHDITGAALPSASFSFRTGANFEVAATA